MEPKDWYIAQVQFVVGAQDAFVVHKDDESFGKGESESPPGSSIRPRDDKVGALGTKPGTGELRISAPSERTSGRRRTVTLPLGNGNTAWTLGRTAPGRSSVVYQPL